MAARKVAKIVTLRELEKVRHQLPPSWTEAAGLLKGKKRVDGLQYQKQVRKAWEQRVKKLASQLR